MSKKKLKKRIKELERKLERARDELKNTDESWERLDNIFQDILESLVLRLPDRMLDDELKRIRQQYNKVTTNEVHTATANTDNWEIKL
jgi:FKBP-type peptidyl-prolyl cis-trans isomerase (trigger factor)